MSERTTLLNGGHFAILHIWACLSVPLNAACALVCWAGRLGFQTGPKAAFKAAQKHDLAVV